MDQKTIEKMISSGRLDLPFWRKVDHYFIVIFLLIAPAISTYSLIEYYLLDTYDGVRTSSELASGYIWLIPALAFIYIQWYRLKFTKHSITTTNEQIEKALKQTIKDLEWRIETKNNDFVRAFSKINLTSGGEMITIISIEDSILINSICDPHKRTSVVSFGMNRTNIRTFMINLSNEINSISTPKPEELYNKWSLGNNLLRVFTYPFCIGLALFSILYIIPEGQLILGIVALLIPSYYFYTDLK